MELHVVLFWILLTIVLLVTEAATTQLITIWFAFGAFSALIAAILSASLPLQIIVFMIVSVLSLILTRPLVKKHINQKKIPTNSDRVIGKTGIVTETIDNTKAVGLVTADGVLWSAKSSDGSVIEKGNKVIINSIEGVKLVVTLK